MTEKTLKSATQAPQIIRRRNYFVKKWLQGRYIVYYLSLLAASSAVFAILVYRSARSTLLEEMIMAHSDTIDTWSILEPEIMKMSTAVTIGVIVLGGLITVLIYWTVRRASEKIITNISVNTPPGLETGGWTSLRHPPEFQRLQESLREALGAHHGRLERLHREIGDLAKDVGQVREAAEKDGVADIDEEIARLRQKFVESRDHLQAIKVE